MSDDLVKRLFWNTPNWRREKFVNDWRSRTTKYDSAPFEDADRIEELESELSLLEEGLTAAYLSGSFDGRKKAEAKLTRIQGAISQQSLAEGGYGEEGRALAAEIYSILYKEESNE